jgi:hypothetical protein
MKAKCLVAPFKQLADHAPLGRKARRADENPVVPETPPASLLAIVYFGSIMKMRDRDSGAA